MAKAKTNSGGDQNTPDNESTSSPITPIQLTEIDKQANMKQFVAQLNTNLIDSFTGLDETVIVQKSNSKEISKEQVEKIFDRIGKTKDISSKTAAMATAALFRKGAANAAASDTMEVEVSCKQTKTSTTITRYDLVMAINLIAGHKNVRKLAEAIAPEMLFANLKLIESNPLLDLKGDLANRINNKLTLRKETALSRKEEICCCTFAQWMPNLNDLADSTRLKSLLEEDLNARRKKNAKKGSATKADNSSKPGSNNQPDKQKKII